MGTIYSLYIYAQSEQQAAVISELVFEEVDRIEQILSNYRASSELSRINQHAAQGPVVTDPETFAFLQTSLDWSARTDGAFDITVGALMKAWGFFRAKGHVPSAEELAAVQNEIGWRHVLLDPRTRAIRFNTTGLELDPGGIGKGYAVDKMVEILRAQHVQAALISAGSSTIYALGAPPGESGWKVEIPDPENPEWQKQDKPISTVILRDSSLSTSACSEKFFILAGHRYCHIMDPHTLRPVEDMVQTTAIDPSATASDALSASLFVLGPDASKRLLDDMPHTSALLLSGRDGHVEHCTAIRWPDMTGPR